MCGKCHLAIQARVSLLLASALGRIILPCTFLPEIATRTWTMAPRPLLCCLLALGTLRENHATQNDFLPTQTRIVGGTVATKKYPYLGFPAGRTLCGVTLIHSDILLTAAHCEYGEEGENTFNEGVVLGGHKINGSDGEEYIQTDMNYPHPDYGSAIDPHDIMLVRLTKQSTATPVTLSTNEKYPVEGATMTLLGWGTTSQGGAISSDLLTTDVKVTNYQSCANYYGNLLDGSVFCAAWPEDWSRDSCQGDSGELHASKLLRGMRC